MNAREMDSLRILHVIPRLGSGGPMRSLMAMAKWGARSGRAWEHDVIVVEPAVVPVAVVGLRTAGARLHIAPDGPTRDALHARSDVTIVHYWQCPSLVGYFAAWPPTPAPVVGWIHILAQHAPQVVSPAVLRHFDRIWLTSSASADAPFLRDVEPESTEVVLGLMDPDRVLTTDYPARDPDEGVIVGYIGTVNRQKMHPEFVAMCAAVTATDARFAIYGSGGDEDTLVAEAARVGIADRFEIRGHTEHIADALAAIDILGCPLSADTYASSDLVVQEASWAGVPSVLLRAGGAYLLVEPGQTGLIADSLDDYVTAVDALVRDPARRRQLGEGARAHARAHFDPQATVARIDTRLRTLVADPDGERAVPAHWAGGPADWFLCALGTDAEAFTATLTSMPALMATGEGGLFQWRNAFPDDAQLNDWTAEVAKHR